MQVKSRVDRFNTEGQFMGTFALFPGFESYQPKYWLFEVVELYRWIALTGRTAVTGGRRGSPVRGRANYHGDRLERGGREEAVPDERHEQAE